MRRAVGSRWVAAAAVVLAGAVLPGVARALTPSTPAVASTLTLPFKLGAYTGTTAEQIPRVFTGKINFLVHREALTALSFTVGVVCKGMWVVDYDTLTNFKVRIHHDGAFSYSGTTQGRQILFKGRLKADRATGSLSQAFQWGSERCVMGHSASFTATR